MAQESGYEHSEIVGVLKSLYAADYVVLDQLEQRYYELTDEAESYAKEGSPEVRFMRLLESKGEVTSEEAKAHPIGFGKCMKNKWLIKEGDLFKPKVSRDTLTDDLANKLNLLKLKDVSLKLLEEYSTTLRELKMHCQNKI